MPSSLPRLLETLWGSVLSLSLWLHQCLEVVFGSSLAFWKQVTPVARNFFFFGRYHTFCRLPSSLVDLAMPVHIFLTSWLDYCTVLCVGLPLETPASVHESQLLWRGGGHTFRVVLSPVQGASSRLEALLNPVLSVLVWWSPAVWTPRLRGRTLGLGTVAFQCCPPPHSVAMAAIASCHWCCWEQERQLASDFNP